METSAINTEYLRKLVILYSVTLLTCRRESRSAITCRIRERTTSRIRSTNSWGRRRLSSVCMTISLASKITMAVRIYPMIMLHINS